MIGDSKCITRIRVFCFGESDYIAAAHLGEAITFFKREFPVDLGDREVVERVNGATELTPFQMRSMKFDGATNSPPTETWSFARQLHHLIEQRCEFPCFFASSDY